jgi:hypothetical protein
VFHLVLAIGGDGGFCCHQRGSWLEALGDLARYSIAIAAMVPAPHHGSSSLTTAAVNGGLRGSPVGSSASLSDATSTSSAEERPACPCSPTPSMGIVATRLMKLEPAKDHWRRIARGCGGGRVTGEPRLDYCGISMTQCGYTISNSAPRGWLIGNHQQRESTVVAGKTRSHARPQKGPEIGKIWNGVISGRKVLRYYGTSTVVECEPDAPELEWVLTRATVRIVGSCRRIFAVFMYNRECVRAHGNIKAHFCPMSRSPNRRLAG